MHTPDSSRYYKRTVLKETISSVHLGEDRPLRIYLPPGYNEVLSYPVLYCQDGEQFFNFGRLATLLTAGILDGGLEPAIAIGVDVRTAVRTSEYAPEGERNAAYIRFFAEEMVPYIESRYPVRRTPQERIAAGDSLGGTVSLHLALAYPHLFSNVLSLSGAFFAETQRQLEAAGDLSWLRIHMLIGLDETEVTTERGTFDFVAANRRTKELLESGGARLTYEEKPGKHLWGFWQQELPAILRLFLSD
ncbi:enterochelin esterase [Gordoniibacillus kamchatkensis]|uniref:Enterochelin esterase n=1 Tax=Gordoniibacillus kamchatkensis TaxID=1590651 RepID=A0ABR5AJ62_9BACL|nr:alpha/beta hydrolase-fold protein [Paenibacillus sp. VKM B-2647]KIL41071.1 enterochelin esterase [Paenibacillus sp. VKM B-2647]